MISGIANKAMAFPMDNLKGHGDYYVTPATELYEGMIVGRTNNRKDMVVYKTFS